MVYSHWCDAFDDSIYLEMRVSLLWLSALILINELTQQTLVIIQFNHLCTEICATRDTFSISETDKTCGCGIIFCHVQFSNVCLKTITTEPIPKVFQITGINDRYFSYII